MPTHPASTQRPPDPMPEIGLKEHERRYLRRSLLILCIVFGLLNVIGCRVFISPQLGLGKDGLVRVGYSTRCDEYWPSIPPDPWDWPSPDRCATFRGATPFVSSSYASASDKGMHYTMDVFRCGFPMNAYEIRTVRITKNDGTIVLADPQFGQPARIRVSLIGIGVNTLSSAGGIWLIIGVLPCVFIVLDRRSRARLWREQWMCSGCGYDVQDLPNCPECGTPNECSV